MKTIMLGFARLFLSLALTVLAALPSAQAQSITRENLQDPGLRAGRFWVDINNDGRDDYCVLVGNTRLDCYLSDGKTLAATPTVFSDIGNVTPEGVRWIDQNGDGKVDLCQIVERPDDYYVQCRTGTDFITSVDMPTGPTYPKIALPPDYTRTTGRGDFVFSDLNGDGRMEYCALLVRLTSGTRIACTMAIGGAFSQLANWGKVDLTDVGIEDLRKGGFHDMNGDGYPDFCLVVTNAIRCLLGSKNGPFTGGEVRSTDLGLGNESEGAAFVDINGDGKTDYCRSVHFLGSRHLACRLSTGIGWSSDITTEKMDTGWNTRWWVDVNGDGLPDYCRAVLGTTDPGLISDDDSTNGLSCRLASGDDQLFVRSDITLNNLNFGIADSARGFCDPFGTGISTFCRSTNRAVEDPDNPICVNAEVTYCIPGTRWIPGLMVGIAEQTIPQPPLMTQFSDGVGAQTRIGYTSMSSSQVYYRSGYGEASRLLQKDGSLIVQPRSPVVFETRAWREDTAKRLTGNARYYYKDLRYSPLLGSQGFAERWMLTEGSNTIDHLIYFQGLGNGGGSVKGDYREVGQVRMQQRFAMKGNVPGTVPGSELGTALGHILNTIAAAPNPDVLGPSYILTQRTVNTLGDTSPTANPRIRYATRTVNEKWDLDGSTRHELPKTTIDMVMDSYGNVTRIQQETEDPRTTLRWSQTTVNTYGNENVAAWILGRLTRSEVTSTAPTAAQQLAAYGPRNVGSSPNAADTSSSLPPKTQTPPPNQISPAVLSAILQILLED